MTSLAEFQTGSREQGIDLPDDESTLIGSNLEEELTALSDKSSAWSKDITLETENEAGERIKKKGVPTRFALRNGRDLRQWHRDFEAFAALASSEATQQALCEQARALYNWVTDSVTPFVSSLENYQESLQQENERLYTQIDLWRDVHGELLEAYHRECEASEKKTRLMGEYVAMVGKVSETVKAETDTDCPKAEEEEIKVAAVKDTRKARPSKKSRNSG